MVAGSDVELRELTDQFVRVRLIQMAGVDLSLFQFDYFLSWSVFFMNADKTIYGRFGRAHPNTKRDKKDSNPNHELAGLEAALARALEFHADYAKDPRAGRERFAGKTGPKPSWRFVEKTPAGLKYKRFKRIANAEQAGCVHCHEVQRATVDSLLLTKRRVPDRMLWMYPRPHVLGLELDNRHPARVKRVRAGSPSAEAGIEAGDDLVALAGQPLLSIADLQWVLHNFADQGGKLAVELERAGKSKATTIVLPEGWRRTEDFGWRYRVAGYASWLWAGASFADAPGGIRVTAKAPRWFKKPNEDAKRKFRPGDLIVSVDGTKGLDRSEWLAYLMRDKPLGSTVELVVVRNGKRTELSFRIPSKQPEVLGH